MNDSSDSVELGPWLDADLQGTASVYSGDGSDDDLDEIWRFSRSVCRLMLRRLRQHAEEIRRDAIAIFLLQPTAPTGSSPNREPLLGDGSVEISGKIWFVGKTAQSGRSIEPSDIEDSTMFDLVEELGLGHVPAIVVNPKVDIPVVRVYGKGLSSEEEVDTVDILDKEVDVFDIQDTVNQMCEKQLCTPDAQVTGASMWANAQKCHVASNAEAIAQLQMKTALQFRLFNCDIRHEQRMRAGRTDIEIAQKRADGSIIIAAEIEIKVLRGRNRRGKKWSDSYNEKWIRRGIRQAAAYRDDRSARFGILCCFDMRQTDRGELQTFAQVKPYAEELCVNLHRNFLFNSAEAWRVARYGT
ncbi:MAG: hypothetical protein OXI80_02200 [Caldilineaceae bacterium]|nr:hypothetical protein [Defluviicoccus sp.]MDE0336457.1 hypothetical protein [Caldilineaceae bacterium]